jgi:hypothetical protein
MTLYRNTITGEIRELDDALIAAWQSAGNPKRQQWEAYTPPPPEPPAPPEPQADWLGFAGWLYGYEPMAAAMETARASRDPQGEPATTGLPAAMDEARLRSNYVPFALSWGLFLAASGLPAAEVAAIVARAQECHLPAQFIAALQPAT